MKLIAFLFLFTGLTMRASTLPTITTYRVDLSWQAPLVSPDPVVGYFVYRAPVSESFQPLNESVISSTTYEDPYLNYGVTYQYYVTSADANGVQSSPSNTISLVIPFVPYSPVVGSIQ